tara:strand:+ start:742 stop:1167 length:426 start_codon:yes stop_codon:yes gene_type:complete
MTNFTIGCAAKEAGVSVETIRFYERKGLVQQPRKPRNGGYRTYTEFEVNRIRFIRSAQKLGFSLHEAEELLLLESDTRAKCRDVHAKAMHKLEDVEQKIAQLKAVRSALKTVVDSCPKKGFAAGRCSILQALNVNGKFSRR